MMNAKHSTSNLLFSLPDPTRAKAKVKQEPDVLDIIGPVISDFEFGSVTAKVPYL